MYSTTLLAIACVLVLSAEACTKRRPPPPPTPQPPNAPPPPELPPVIIKVVRQQEQFVGFNKCYRHCGGALVPIDAEGKVIDSNESSTCVAGETPATPAVNDIILESDTDGESATKDINGNKCVGQSDCKYICKFKVYTEIALQTISKPTNCGCAFHMNVVNPRPANVVTSQVLDQYVAQKVEVGDFHLVVWDYKANRVVERVPEFKLEKSEKTKQAIAEQIKAQSTADFTTVTAGYAGQVTRFPELPASLDLNIPANANNVPCLEFEVTQEYDDIKLWQAPLKPQLEQMPNAYQSQCVPFWPANPFCYNSRKRQANKACGSTTTPLYHKKFLLFPKESKIAQNLGNVYAARLITSFYNDDECSHEQGIFSIDSEFKTELKASAPGASLALGTWSWERQFQDGANGDKFGTVYVRGVPGRFSGIKSVWDKGYSTIEWQSFSGFTHGTAGEHDLVDMKICQKFSPTQQPFRRDKYGETALFYKPEAGIECSPFDDVVRQPDCGTQVAPDMSLMAFLNEGAILNFNKDIESTLIMGKMDQSCKTTPYTEVVFDTLTFTGCPPGRHPTTRIADRKRAAHHDDIPELGLIYDDDKEGFVHFLHPSAHAVQQLPHKRSLADALQSQVATPPNEENYDMRIAAGSVDMDGGDSINAGDHALDLFPETFSAPINIDPEADSDDVVLGLVTTGSDVPNCNRGSLGCSCRISGQAACDLGLECDSSAKCMLKSCTAGAPGCPCLAGSLCSDSNHKCVGRVCKIQDSCVAGTGGCQCKPDNSCSDGSSCSEGLCVAPADCAEGDGGCLCTVDNKCADNFECNNVLGLCAAPRCKSGEPGCRCKLDGECRPGFECDTENNVCGLFTCPAGEPGCLCTAQGGCTKTGFECKAYSTTESRCVAEAQPMCGNALARCIKACGSSENISICPPCSNSKVYCKEFNGEVNDDPCYWNPNSPACVENSAASMIMTISAIVVAVVALLF